MNELLDWIIHLIEGLEPQHWWVVFAMVILIGFWCMKGLGSRKSY